jgi:DNA (cytosine-5)-methyltransferase 1
MADVLSSVQRAYNMSQIRARDTKPELQLRDLMVSSGLWGFEAHPKSILGTPDFYFPEEKFAVFVDGCFWHGCERCFSMPANNRFFWQSKIKTNLERDRRVMQDLRIGGISVLRLKEHEINENPSSVLSKLMKMVQPSGNARPRVLDLFSGAGGLSEGFVRAGCELVGHIDMEDDASSTLLTRMIYHALVRKGKIYEYKKYILGKIGRDELIEKYGLQRERDSVICAKIGRDNYIQLITKIRSRIGCAQVDLIVGGPPCQAYSHIGRARDGKSMRWDRRNFLFRYYIEFLKAFKPKIFVFENVPGLISAGQGRYLREMRKGMKAAGYETDFRILNAADFGVPQNRRRIILVGWNSKSSLKKYPEFQSVRRDYRVSDFILDLPKIRSGGGSPLITGSLTRSLFLRRMGISNPRFNFLMDHVARPLSKQDAEIYKLVALEKRKGRTIKYINLPARLKTHKNENIFLDRFKVVDPDAAGSQTVMAHIAKDGHYYIHPDVRQNRSLSIREAARLQTFPDDYKFEGSPSSRFHQIGNAVPPMLSEMIAKELIKYL